MKSRYLKNSPLTLTQLCSATGLYRLIFLMIWLLPVSAFSGELVLKNGDRLQGDLVKLEGESVVWASESFGNLSVAKQDVDQLNTTTLIKMDGHPEPCTITSVSGGNVRFSCADSTSGQVSLLSLELTLPYEDYFAGARTYKGKVALAGTHTTGNKKEEDWELDTEIELRRGDFRHMFGAEYESESTNDAPADEEFEFSYSLDWFFQERWFWYNDVSIGAEESKNIDERYALGSGFGYQFWESDRSALSVESGVSFVKELFDRSENADDTFESQSERGVLRWAANYFYVLPFSAALVHKHEILYSLEDGEDWELDSDTGINIPLGAGLFSEFKVEYDYDNQPLQNEKKSDTKFSVGLGYEW